MRYKISLESKDKHKYLIEIVADTQEKAEADALDRLSEHGWGIYNYKVIKTEKM